MPDQAKSRGRDETDDRLERERRKTDEELAERRADLEEDADAVVERARERADRVIQAMRATQDAQPPTAGTRRDRDHERAHQDRVLAEERAITDDQLEAERTERTQLGANLPLAEREATDHSLRTERGNFDAAITSRDEFLAIVSHDLRALLSGIALNAALLVHEATPDAAGTRVVKRADSVQRFVERMTRLVGDLVDVASIEAGRLQVTTAPRDATRLLRETLDTFQPLAAAHGVALGATMPDDALPATFDHHRLGQVLANLITNAIKFTERTGRVELAVAPDGREVRFTVRDTGRGIAREDLDAIFERFWQAPSTTRHGLGLGLYISKCIVEAHGGRIWAESEVGRGSTFCFTVPRAPA